jgi:hypothetical protein
MPGPNPEVLGGPGPALGCGGVRECPCHHSLSDCCLQKSRNFERPQLRRQAWLFLNQLRCLPRLTSAPSFAGRKKYWRDLLRRQPRPDLGVFKKPQSVGFPGRAARSGRAAGGSPGPPPAAPPGLGQGLGRQKKAPGLLLARAHRPAAPGAAALPRPRLPGVSTTCNEGLPVVVCVFGRRSPFCYRTPAHLP